MELLTFSGTTFLQAAKKRMISIQFVAAHCGVECNEKVDKAANDAWEKTREIQHPTNFKGMVAAIKRRFYQNWTKALITSTFRLYFLGNGRGLRRENLTFDRKNQSSLAQLRTGQCCWIRKFATSIRGDNNNQCRWCKSKEESVDHIFNECSNRDLRTIKRNLGIYNTRGLADVSKVILNNQMLQTEWRWSRVALKTP